MPPVLSSSCAYNNDVTCDMIIHSIGFFYHEVHKLLVTPPTWHSVSSEGVVFFFPIYYKLINFKLVHSYNVKHLTCNILCSNELQNIYKLHIWKCSTFTIFTLLIKETKIHIH